MTDSVQDLLAVEERLDRSFAVAITAFLAQVGWPLLARVMGVANRSWVNIVFAVLVLVMMASYLWFAYAASAAAKRVGRSRLLIGAWIVLAPIIAQLPIPVVSLLIGASPLSIKFILAGELRSEIQARTLA